MTTSVVIRARLHAVAESEADARSGLRHFRHRVLPRALRAAAGHQQIAAAQRERARGSTAARPHQESAPLTDRDQRDDRIDDLLADPIAMPRDAVLPVAVVVEADRIE